MDEQWEIEGALLTRFSFLVISVCLQKSSINTIPRDTLHEYFEISLKYLTPTLSIRIKPEVSCSSLGANLSRKINFL